MSTPSRTNARADRACLIKSICAVLAFAVWAVYGQVRTFEFINYDDPFHIINNPSVAHGLSWEGAAWAFTSIFAANWYPLTWLSHMTDVQLFGMDPGMHHLVNVFLHAANSILLFLLLATMTGSVWRSALVAGLFALHPLHVESVAWISERKDVLSTFFWLLTMAAYSWYVRRRGIGRYLAVAVLFSLGLMAKPMMVTLPFVLLLMDFWPLKRIGILTDEAGRASGENSPEKCGINWSALTLAVREKIPLMLLALAASGMTLYAQKMSGAMSTLENIPLGRRLGNALVSYVLYLWKTIWPFDLAVFYPYTAGRGVFFVGACVLLITAVTTAVVIGSKRYGYLAAGWFWYLGTLVPVIGIVQVGSQSMADRYTYIPLIGIFILISWGANDFLIRGRHLKTAEAFLFPAFLVVLAFLSWHQVSCWKDSITLFSHALEVTENNYLAQNNLGAALFARGKTEEAVARFKEALRTHPRYVIAHDNIAGALINQKKYDEALAHYRISLRLDPEEAKSHYNMAFALSKVGDMAGAVEEYGKALIINSRYTEARNNLALILASQGKTEEALGHYQVILRYNPGDLKAQLNVISLLTKQNRLNEALSHLEMALREIPDNPDLYYAMGETYAAMALSGKARASYEKALSVRPDHLQTLYRLAMVQAQDGSFDAAISSFERMAFLKPDDPDVFYNIACLYSRKGDTGKTVEYLKTALGKGFSDWDLLKSDADMRRLRSTIFYHELIKNH